MVNIIRTVRFFGTQGCEDLYKCKETGGVFIRQGCDDKYVRWLTSVKWQGGYEADCPLKEGLVIIAVDAAGEEVFREKLSVVEGYMDTVAERVGPFSGEAIAALANAINAQNGLLSYYEWKDRLMSEANAVGYSGYSENWLYDADYEKPEKIAKMDYLGVFVYAIKERAKHRQCGKQWTAYEIRTADMSTCLAICGYEFKEE